VTAAFVRRWLASLSYSIGQLPQFASRFLRAPGLGQGCHLDSRERRSFLSASA
jgi:hypothetical protein